MRMYQVLTRNLQGQTKAATGEPAWKTAMREGRAAGMPSIGDWLCGIVHEPPAKDKSLKDLVLDGMARAAGRPVREWHSYPAIGILTSKAGEPATPKPPKPGSLAAMVVEKMKAALARGVK